MWLLNHNTVPYLSGCILKRKYKDTSSLDIQKLIELWFIEQTYYLNQKAKWIKDKDILFEFKKSFNKTVEFLKSINLLSEDIRNDLNRILWLNINSLKKEDNNISTYYYEDNLGIQIHY